MLQYEPTDITLDVAQNALSFCNCHDRDEWVMMGMALKAEFGSDGFDIWDHWSQDYAKYESAVVKQVWTSFRGGKVSIGSLIDTALKGGFKFEIKEVSPEDRKRLSDERNAKMKARQDQDVIDEQKKTDYRQLLSSKLTEAVNDPSIFTYSGKCEYLDKKQVGAFGVLFPNKPIVIVADHKKGLAYVISGHADFTAFLNLPSDQKPVHRIVKKGAMMVPLYDENFNIWNLQVIYNTGKKRFLSGRVMGCFHIVGQIPMAGGFNIAFAEGYANAASIYQALNCPVVVCFNAGNIENCALTIQKMYGARISSYLFCADDDAHLVEADQNKNPEKNKGYMKAKKAADLVDGLVILPFIDPIAVADDDSDSLYVNAVALVVDKQKVSASLLQKELRIGYSRAVRLIDIMQNKEIVSEKNDKGTRKVLVKK